MCNTGTCSENAAQVGNLISMRSGMSSSRPAQTSCDAIDRAELANAKTVCGIYVLVSECGGV